MELRAFRIASQIYTRYNDIVVFLFQIMKKNSFSIPLLVSPSLGGIWDLGDTPDPQQEDSCTSFSAASFYIFT